MNVNKLKGLIVEKGLSVEKLADMLSMNRATLYRKLNNCDKVTIGDALKMKEALNMSDDEAYRIFLA